MTEKDEWPFPLNRWRETQIPAWQRILREAIESKDNYREAYARQMLTLMGVEEVDFPKSEQKGEF